MVLGNLTQVGKIGLGLFVAGTVVFVIGFSVPYWAVYSSIRIGLWEACHDDYCFSTTGSRFQSFGRDGPPSWFQGTQALACLALIALIVDFILRLLFLCGKPIKFLLFSIICDCAASVLAFLAAVVFGSEVEKYYNVNLHFGFAFDIIGGILLAFAAVCFLVEYCRRR
ncbi:uncharacterized protein LOC143279823 [Babylonia areolata]|uniref:uncharacterized protein LOC143279823 n=1 Tax=Babylonia areolata TaxID=304850 RepID=UPI003FD37992